VFLAWIMDRQLRVFQQRLSTLEPAIGEWLLVLLLGVLAGLVFGLALTWPTRLAGYRWGRVLFVVAIPVAVLILSTVIVAARTFDLPEIFLELTPFSFESAGSLPSIAAVMLGAALGSGFAEPRQRA
jgi:ABC-type proline/glycine betaine transport system permease subunit